MRFFDLHCDTPYLCYKDKIHFNDLSLAVTPKKAAIFSVWQQCFAVFVDDKEDNPLGFYNAVLKNFKAELKNRPENLIAHFTLENASLIDSTEKVDLLKRDNIRAVTLTWNGENQIAGGKNSDKGLTQFGKDVISALNKNKIFTDLSHLNEKSFYAAIEESLYPIATHSNCRDLCQNKRNLYLDEISLIAEKGGVVGLCFYPDFLKTDVFEGIYQNIFYLADKGYQDSIAIGSDFDGGIMDKRLDGIDKIPCLYGFLTKRGFEKQLLDKIFYYNALKCFDKTVTMI